jgi:NADH-quinone oxidoreductase subunit C
MPEGATSIIELLQSRFPEEITSVDEVSSPICVTIKTAALVNICDFLHTDSACYFAHLACITGVDNGPEANSIEVVYNLYSIPFDRSLMIKVLLDREKPSVSTLTSIWKGANWLERETFDLFGVHFEGHPDLRRILLPDDWEGFPLRKDYKHQEYYRGMKVQYEQQDPV